MAEDSRDILMKLVLDTGKVFPTECQAVIAAEDTTMAAGFTRSATDGPNFFAVDEFTFKVGLTPDNSAVKLGGAMKDTLDQHMAALTKQLAEKSPELEGLKLGGAKDASSYTRFMTNGRAGMLRAKQQGQGQMYGADLDEIQITKALDASSLTLLDACLKSATFKSATLLKRKAVGQTGLRGYLRIDFNEVMLTEFNWANDEVVKETFKFVCREAVVQYAIEEMSGKLTPQATRKWAVQNLKKT